MEKQITVWIGAVLLLAALDFSEAQVIPTYFEVDGTLDLRPTVKETIINILWKYNGNLLAEWVKNQVDLFYYDKYKNRTTLNTATGQLVMKNVKKDDVGLYTVEINNKVHGQSYDVKWITRVPKPTVVIRTLTCGPDSESCLFTCDVKDADSLRDAEPIQYSWRMGEKDLEMMMKDIIVSSDQTETEYIKTISCLMKNPVSEEDSELIQNPMYKEPEVVHNNSWVIVGCIFSGLAALLGVGVWVWKFRPDLLPGRMCQSGGGNDVEATGLKPANVDPNNSTGAETNNSTGAETNNSTGAEANNSTGAEANKSPGSEPNDTSELQPLKETDSPTPNP